MKDLELFLENWLEENGLENPAAVNCGMCEEFAIDLSNELVDSQVVYTEDFIDWDSPDYPGGHCWVKYEGKFYDSECLEGVYDWRHLEFFKRKK